LKRLRGIELFYLAGETAVAHHLGHRQSIDLDFFSLDRRVNLETLSEEVADSIPEAQILSKTDAVLRIRVGSTPVDLVRYRYPPLARPEPGPRGFPVAGLLDLAAMKLAAISTRGIRRDFWDLYVILRSGIPLREAGEAYVKRFGVGQADLYQVARSLTYFGEAEKARTLPKGLTRDEWGRIKRFFLAQAPKLIEGP
jgi:hypothetical protein